MRPIRVAVVCSALTLAGFASVDAQSVESMLRSREQLELTEDQVARLDQIRARAVEQRMAEEAVLAELRSQLAAGQIQRSEVMAAMEDRREATRTRAEERRAQVDSILTEEQRATVDRMGRRSDRVRAGRRGGFGRGGAARPRFGPGRRGFGPR